MRGSRIAAEIEQDIKREQYFKRKVIRNQCIINKEKQCDKCGYRDICEDYKETIK